MKRPSHRLRPKRYPSTPAVDETARGGHASTAETAFAHHATEPPSTTFADVDGRRDTKQPLHQDYQRMISAGKNPSLARLTIARKIAAAVLAMWKTKEEYDPAKSQPKPHAA